MAPELLRGELCSVESDVYALGMTLFEIVAREIPFCGREAPTITKVVQDGERPQIPLAAPRSVIQTISSCWRPNALDRPKVDRVIQQIRTW
mmetsp:Transcript_7948/g.17398  ORF Transcript_7948/g.17398 Transcript_7948/m.17398 type:complete len:91 (+) Transcript_7948:800-1072(+)